MKLILWLLSFVSCSAFGSSIEVGDPQIGGSLAGGTAGSLLYIGSGPVLSQNNTNLFWDATNLRLGILTAAPASPLSVAGIIQSTTGGFTFPDGSTQATAATAPAINATITGGTACSVLFVGAGPVIAQDNSAFCWDVTNHRLGVGTNTPSVTLNVVSSQSAPVATFTDSSFPSGISFKDVPGNEWFIGTGVGSNTDGKFRILDLAQLADRLMIDTMGHVGIATTSPDANLTVYQNAPTVPTMSLKNTTSGGGLLLFYDHGGSNKLTLTAPAAYVASYTLTLPTQIGASGGYLQADSSGTLSFNPGPTIVSSTTNTSATCSASCTASAVLTGGGCQNSGALVLQSSYPSSATAWSCTYTTAAGNCTAKAICE